MAAQTLSSRDLDSSLEQLAGWSIQAGKLHREYKFTDFAHAFGFMATAAVLIEKRNHHPEWLNVYNRVVVDLTTHDSGGITQKDVELARMLESIAAQLSR